MAWRRPAPGPAGPPAWYRLYDPAAWDEPDAHEVAMLANWPPRIAGMLPSLHAQHARRRWHEAQDAYRRQHPRLATQEFAGILARRHQE